MRRVTRSGGWMSWVLLLVAFVVGIGASTQFAMVGSLSRERGATEAAFISLMATVMGIALVLAVRSLRGDTPFLPSPLDRLSMQLVVAAAAFTLLVISLRGAPPYFAATGLFAVAFLVTTAFVVPRIGVGLYFIVNATGTLMGGMLFDHFGAFGATPIHISPMRLAGFAVVFAGIAVVRFAR